jgi:hypothetical protein
VSGTTGISAPPRASRYVPRPADAVERDAGFSFAPVASDLQPGETAIQALPYRWRRLRRPTVALHADRPCFSLGTIGLADGLRSAFTGLLGPNLGAGDPAAEDNLAGLGAHGRALQRALRAGATPLGLGARNALGTPRFGQCAISTR